MFLIFMKDIDEVAKVSAESTLLDVADDNKLRVVVEGEEQRDVLQDAIKGLEGRGDKWQMEFDASKCHVLHQKCWLYIGRGGAGKCGGREGCWGHDLSDHEAVTSVCQGQCKSKPGAWAAGKGSGVQGQGHLPEHYVVQGGGY